MSRHVHPPRWAAYLLDRLLPDGDSQTPLGDFEEVFHNVAHKRGYAYAKAWYVSTVLGMIPRRFANSVYWNVIMIRNYIKTSIRNLLRYKTYSAINLLGLTLGTACFILIFQYVSEERSFDTFHEGADRVYRVNVDYINPTSTFSNALSSAPMGPAIAESATGVDSYVRIRIMQPEPLVSRGDVRFFEKDVLFADSTFFDVFTFRFMQGDPSRALDAPYSVVLTRSVALRYFGLDDPMGETIRLNNSEDYVVTGVIADVPSTSHFSFSMLLSFSSLTGSQASWWSNPYYTYLKLAPAADPAAFDFPMEKLVEQNMEASATAAGIAIRLWLQPLLDIRMNPQGNDISTGRGASQLAVLSGIAILILFLACINFTNLATARSDTRAKEVGMRKVIGANRTHLVSQFLGESTLLATLAVGTGFGLAMLCMPWFESLVGRAIGFRLDASLVGTLALTAVGIGLVAGLIPALQLSGVEPIRALKSAARGAVGRKRSLFRRGLVIMQFSVSVTLIIITVMVFRQVQFMKTTDLGLDPEQVVVLPLNADVADRTPALKAALSNVPGVHGVSFANRAPGTGAYGNIIRRPDREGSLRMEAKILYADEGYLDLLGIPLAAGRYFESASSLDNASTDDNGDAGEVTREVTGEVTVAPQFVLNERAVLDLGWESAEAAIGGTLEWSGDVLGEVIGVMEDFHFQSMTVHMQPVLLQQASEGQGVLLVKVSSGQVAQSVEAIRAAWGAIAPEWPFLYSFLDQDYDALYRSEEQYARTFSTFTLLALVIACLGLFGLATFSVQRRSREMGIRKALGASQLGIASMLSKEFAVLVGVANIIAWPAAWLFVRMWLNNFAFKTNIAIWIFLVSGAAALFIALLTVGSQALRAARTNPVEALRFE